MITSNHEFMKALPIIEKIQEAGFEAYFVGGCVRDALLNKDINDVDIATSAFPTEVKKIFSKTFDVGIEHGTVMVLRKNETYEVTTFRTESTYQDFRRPDEVVFVRSLKEDLKRRDFTVNALAMDQEGQVIDYFGGQDDLKKGLIKAVGSPEERFFEDALRMMRGVRFISQLDFVMDNETEKAIHKNHALLEHIAVERIQVEFMKLLLGKGRQKALKTFIETELYYYCPELSTYKNELASFAGLKGQIPTQLAAWTLLLAFLEKSEDEIEPFLRKWKCSKKEMQRVKTAYIALQQRLKAPLTRLSLYQSGYDIALEVEAMLPFFNCESDIAYLEEVNASLPIRNKQEMAVSGNDLLQQFNAKPGKWLGEALDAIERAILLDEVVNERDQLLDWTHSYLKKKRDNS